ncbi:beta/gamma crystallin-related protein [Hyalangium versicolor]|uniref:beta/gamma crystallin-related protein n=1 Tax=Hyalangium versicolor TaxID=2861190 RepID=UPI001CCE1191|nr:beta/gamma crystallin-related protein [Hyalangium versicolor]
MAYPVDPSNPARYFPHTPPLSSNRNNENVVLELAWPYAVTGIGASDQQVLINNYYSRPFQYGGNNVWDPAPIQAARLGLGDEAYAGMKAMIQRYQDYPNGRTTNTNGEFEYLGVHLNALNESLLQSHDDKIRVFPAVPGDATLNSKFTLLASGGFLVSSERESSEIKYVGIKSLYGNPATVVNPWGTQQVQVRRLADNALVTTSSSGAFTFNTVANGIYVVERVSKTLGAYTPQELSGSPNNTVKTVTFNGVPRSLGSAAPYTGPMPTFYSDPNFGGVGISLPPGSYGISQMQAAGIPNDAISSIQVPAGVTVVAYGDGAFDGPSWTFTSDNSNLANTGNDNTISSFKITVVESGVTFYPDRDFGGAGVTLGVGSYNIAQMQAAGIVNDSISSIRVPAGRTVTAYQDGAFDGSSWTFTADNSNLANTGNDNTISSFRVQ